MMKATLPKAKIKAKDGYIETDIWDMDLMDFLGSQGWELIVGYDSGAPGSRTTLLFKRSISDYTAYSLKPELFDRVHIWARSRTTDYAFKQITFQWFLTNIRYPEKVSFSF